MDTIMVDVEIIHAGGLLSSYYSAVADVVTLAVVMAVVTMVLVEITAAGLSSSYYSSVAVSEMVVAANH